jgi:hypothetical protein
VIKSLSMKKILLSSVALLGLAACACAQPWANAVIDVNKVKTTINSNGDLFWNYSSGRYEVPADSGRHTIFAGATWIGGLDAAGTLHVAAQTYRQSGNDFYPGPVMNTSSYSAATDAQWNQVWKINKATIDSFIIWFANPSVYPGYTVPAVITNWPSNGDVVAGQAAQLAPYVDVNSDAHYDPSNGDYPCIKGDQALFVIYNDDRNTHTESGGAKFTLEVHAMMYAYSAPGSWLDSAIFINYKLYNRSTTDYDSLYWGHWNDYDIGDATDDYVGCDVARSIGYAYNGDANDGATALPAAGTYGANPPAQGLKYLRGPEATPLDGVDNDRDGTIDEADETWAMSHFVYYNNDFSVTGNPAAPMDYYYYLNGYWKNGTTLTYGGNGYGGSTPADFMFPADSDPLGWGTNFVPQAPWDEMSSGNLPGDRRALSSSGPFRFDAGKQMCIDVVSVFGQGAAGPASGIRAMQNASDSAATFYAQNNPCTCDESTVGIASHEHAVVGLYPNPATETVNIVCGDNASGSVIEIADATGKVVHTSTVLSGNSAVVDISNLPAGIYFVRVNKGSVVLSGKFIRS